MISWLVDPDAPGYPAPPSTDCDLFVRRPSGSYATWSASWDNSFEIVDFTATETGRAARDHASVAVIPR